MKQLDNITKRLLCKEAALSSMNLGVGMTFLRKYNFAEIGFIYQSFFSLSVGLERLMKLILIYEHIYISNTFPSQAYLKGLGHDLTKLFLQVRTLSTKYSTDKYFATVDSQEICKSILQNLSDFAKYNRYSHLNKLSGNNNTDDPLIRWEKEINSVIVEKHYRLTEKDEFTLSLAKSMEDSVFIMHTSESDNDITDYKNFIKQGLQIEVKRKYGMYYTYWIVKSLCELQVNQNYQSNTDVALHEFFKIFRADYSYAFKKKSWNPYSPFHF